MKYVLIEYTLRDDVDISTVKGAIAEFVGNIKAHHASNEYTSFQRQGTRSFTHMGTFDDAHTADLQAQPWFGKFSAFLRTACANGPNVSMLDKVATTR